MARKLTARGDGGYDSKAHGGFEGGGGPPGNFMLNPKVTGVNLVFPSFNKGPTVFRPFPVLDFKEPQNKLQPGRLSPEPKSYSQWLVKIPSVTYTGLPDCEKVSFLLYHPATEKDDKANNPYVIFYRACEQAKKTARFGNGKKWDSDWNKFMEGKKGEGAAIKDDGFTYFSQGACWCSGEKDYMEDSDREKPYGLNAKDRLPVFQFPMSVGIGLMTLFDREKESYDGDPETDFSLPFVFGDPVGKFLAKKQIVKGGYIIRVYNPTVTKIKQADNNTTPPPKKEGEAKKIGYSVELLKEYEHNDTTYTSRLDSDDVKQVFEKSQFWFDDPKKGEEGLLRFAPYEQQAVWIAKAFKSAPRLVTWAFSEHEEYLTDEVKGILAARVSAVVPGSGEEGGDADDDGDDEDKPKQKKSKKTDPTVAKGKKGKPKDDDEDEDDDKDDADDDSDDDDDEEEKKSSKGKKSKKDEDDDSDDDDEEEGDDEDDDSDDDEEDDDSDDDDSDSDSDDDDDDEEKKPSKKDGKGKKKDTSDDDDEEEGDDEDDDDSDSDDDDDEEGDDDSDDDEDEKPAKKGDKGKKPVKEEKAAKKEKKSEKKAAKKSDDDDDDNYFADDDDNDKAAKKSLKAAKGAKERSEKRKTPDKEAPKPPKSKGGTAKKK